MGVLRLCEVERDGLRLCPEVDLSLTVVGLEQWDRASTNWWKC
jgi:hypothetical protein